MRKERMPFVEGKYCNREYAQLQFYRRILAEAANTSIPLLERWKFLEIYRADMEDFFATRIGGLCNRKKFHPQKKEKKSGLTADELLRGILPEIRSLYAENTRVVSELRAATADAGVRILTAEELTPDCLGQCEKVFAKEVLPALSREIVDRKHPPFHFENGRIYAAYRLRKKGKGKTEKFALAMLSKAHISKRILIRLENKDETKGVPQTVIPETELMKIFGEMIFRGYEVKEKALFCVTRSGKMAFFEKKNERKSEEDTDSAAYLERVKRGVENRARGEIVCLDWEGEEEGKLLDFLCDIVKIKREYAFCEKVFFENSLAEELGKIFPPSRRRKLKFPPFRGEKENLSPKESVISRVQRGDLLLAYPFDGMEPLIELLNECAEDERVLSIKIAVYRLDEGKSRIAAALERAAEKGKAVTVVTELNARSDEINNIRYAKGLQKAGCTVFYGVEGLKIHSKIFSVLLRDREKEDGTINYITHVGTGNYNESTSRQYTDLNLITADRGIGEEAAAFFDGIAVGNLHYPYKNLSVSPIGLREKLVEEIRGQAALSEAGGTAQIIAKANALTDKQIIDELYSAAEKGVEIYLIIRGCCCLLPRNIKNIRIISVVGRFLEHSRVYCFGRAEREKGAEGFENTRIYISSADMMKRNLEKRVEIASPIRDCTIKERIYSMLEKMLADNVNAWEMSGDGSYRKAEKKDAKEVNSQEITAVE